MIDLRDEDQPLLLSAVRAVRPGARVSLSGDAALEARLEGGAVQALLGRRSWSVRLGYFTLRELTVGEVQSLLSPAPSTRAAHKLAACRVAWSAWARAIAGSGRPCSDLFACVAAAQAAAPRALFEDRFRRA